MRLFTAPPDLERNSSLQASYLDQQTKLWTALLAGRKESLVEDDDRRFAAREWRENPYFDYLRQSYLLAAKYIEQVIGAAPLEPAAKERALFAARQWVDAMCPANFAATNPAALRAALDTKGESLARGMANLLADASKGRISQTDETAFALGRNIATTPGEVVYENDLIQLIQYRPRTEEVAKRPLVMIPPCINKYYILDLQPENSFVGYAVDSGHTVFMVSWRNVGPEQGHYGWDDYLELGVFSALRVAQEITTAISRSCSPACARTISSGLTSSTTICSAGSLPRSTCSTGTRTAPICPARCTATTCATPTSKTSCAFRTH